ncbi:isopenicillin N synthase family dioxygenase [Marinobacterium lutimaris]|uniref:2-oxoglutarate-dependent ethylene/succinate-forming enzyme n=1 Tax=Marinobacterium lutimaris TaxID=568106 RepID=A0A1H5TJ15_9GAMM|nr:2-oxoglutarate and iron-dependent oxygenase domain-containing protein [Marinobacterium lutimaris]SEF62805.1 Isopenicillin N synthase [Marinobacterium lutimaris]
MDSLPIISLAKLNSQDPAERQAVADELGRACREVGFFYVIDHGIPQPVIDRVFSDARRFFDLPLAQKEALSIKRSAHNRGYVAMADEQLNPAAGADMKEAFNIGVELAPDHPDLLADKPFRGPNFWPEMPDWREQMLEYFDACVELGRLIHRGLSLDLGVDEQFFARHLANPLATLRMLRYPASADAVKRDDGGAGAHTDYGNITILATDGVAGLEVSTRDGDWIQAPSVPGAFVCNIGDCLMRWSNDTYVSTPHRVRPPESERYSVAFFMEADPDSIVDPRELRPDEEPKYEPVRFVDYLTGRLNATYGFRAEKE